jgi:deoxyadenosine/deoxycytidine kinase
MPKPILISLEGNIGAGKSTLLETLEQYLGEKSEWVFLKEPVHIWDTIRDADGETILSKFYADPKKYAFAFQIMAYTTRLHELKRILAENPDCKGVICERSLEADKEIFAKMLRDDGTMDQVMYEIYERYFSEYEGDYQLSGVIYVDAAAETCFERVKKRSRDGEGGILLEYLQRCRNYHERWLNCGEVTQDTQQNTNLKVLHIDTNAGSVFDITNPNDKVREWLNDILLFIGRM